MTYETKKNIITIALALVVVGGITFFILRDAKTSEAPVVVDTENVSVPDENTLIEQIPIPSETSTNNNSQPAFSSEAEAIAVVSGWLEKSDYMKAIYFAEQAISRYPNSGSLRIYYASALYLVGEKDKAFTVIDKAIEVDPTNYLTWRYKIIITKKKLTSSDPSYKTTVSTLYENALAATKNNIELITPYAIFLEEMGDKDGAIRYWKLAIQVNPLAKVSYQEQVDRLSSPQ